MTRNWTATKREVGVYKIINAASGSCFISFLACSRKQPPGLKRSTTCSSGCSHSSAKDSQLYWNTYAYKGNFSYPVSINRSKKVITYRGHEKNLICDTFIFVTVNCQTVYIWWSPVYGSYSALRKQKNNHFDKSLTKYKLSVHSHWAMTPLTVQ